MTEAKPSGIRPPSKIGRPCSMLPPRPAVPPSPQRSSTNQMDHYSDSHGRRLSEAGVRRGSDNSVILTEDTDSFIIGDRVWVGGTKPGSIAYIGETQFAPGDWAGVVLDEPIGKNDGSVAGFRYFQCEPKRGIFSRLTKLTRQPLAITEPSSTTSPTSPMSPESSRAANLSLNKSMSPSLNASTTSLSSTFSTTQRDLRIGERVIVSSSQGSKTGVLRYIGATDFAAGEWCGVELDEPIGKNDGSVEDKRYFECRPKYGLFAPTHKVTRSPSSKRSSCVVHKPTGAALNSTLRKASSRESLASATSVASTRTAASATTTRRPGLRAPLPARNTLQESLKEKQQEIEFLRKERDLERERVTKAANQADQAEQSAISIKQEYDKYREEMQKTVCEAEAALTKLLEEKNSLALQLEEEKRKCEDLLFRFEEESVNKDDIQKLRTEQSVINNVNENKIKELEKQLTEERERVIQLENDNIRLFEAEEELTRLRNEVSVTANDKAALEEVQKEKEKLVEAKASLEKEIQTKSTLIEEYIENIRVLEERLSNKERERMILKESEANLRTDLEETRKNLLERCALMENLKRDFVNSTDILKEECRQAKETIETIQKRSAEEKEELENKCRKVVEERDNLLKAKAEQLQAEVQKQLMMQDSAMEDMKIENMKQINELSKSFNEQLSMKDSKIKEISSQLESKISEAEKLISELSSRENSCREKDKELKDALDKLEDLNKQLKATQEDNEELRKKLQDIQSKFENSKHIVEEKQKLEEDIGSLMASAKDSTVQLEKSNEELKKKDQELTELRAVTAAKIEELTDKFQRQIDDKSKRIEEMTTEMSEKCSMIEKLEKEVGELKSIVASKEEEIKNLLERTSDLSYSLTLSEQTKTNLESEMKGFEANIETLNQQLARAEEKVSQTVAQKEKLESDIANLVSTSADSSEQLVKYNEDLRKKEKELDEMRDKVFETQKLLTASETKLNQAEEDLKKNTSLIQQLEKEIETNKSQLDSEKAKNKEFSDKINDLRSKESEFLNLIEENKSIKKNLDEEILKVSNLEDRLKSSQEETEKLRAQYESTSKLHDTQSSSKEKEIADLKNELSVLQEETKELQKLKTKLEAERSSYLWSIEELTEKFAIETKARSELESALSEKEKKLEQAETRISELEIEKEALAISKETANKTFTNSLSTMTLTAEDLKSKLAFAMQAVKEQGEKLLVIEEAAGQKEARISELSVVISNLKDANNKSTMDLKSAQEMLARRETEIREMLQEKAHLQSNIETLQSKLKIVHNELSDKDEVFKVLEENKRDLHRLREEYKKVSELKDSLENEVSVKQSELKANLMLNAETERKRRSLEDLLNQKNTELSAKELIIDELKAELKAQEVAEGEKVKAEQQTKNEEIKTIQNDLEEMCKQNQNLLHAKERLENLVREQRVEIEILGNTMKNKEKEADKNTQNLMEKLNVVTAESAQLKEAHSRLEKEHKQVLTRWTEAADQLKSHNNIKNNINVDNDSDTAKLQEEYETAKSQIDFLNSVIVDMQRKNEALLCKVEVLEMGIPSNEADDYSRSTLEKRIAPRMFCDICDQFDLHETEDCPRQAQDFPEHERRSKSPKKPSVERPYCENCEMFGHDTKDCDDTETF